LKNNELVINVAVQCVLSIASFHKMGYVHHDCHWGNFLYHLTDDKSGYYHYKINNEDFYLKNCGYTMMIYDFGLSSKYTKVDSNTLKVLAGDYIRILQAFKNKTLKGWCESRQYPTVLISTQIDRIQDTIIAASKRNIDETYLLNNVILPTLLNISTNGIFLRRLPQSETVVNSLPYIIDDNLNKK
jgi:predicted unusual protein kinase regulating ubiquinone biosynthesis (AarF/ABC1/UbiB family)